MGSPDLSTSDRKVDWTAASLWLVGIVCYHLLGNFAPQWGSALPTLALTFSMAWLTRPAAAALRAVRV